jgi:hypothetical protein
MKQTKNSRRQRRLQRTYQRHKQRFSRKTLRGGENTPETDKPWHRRWITSPLKKKLIRAKQMYEGLRNTRKSENPGLFSRLKTRVNNFRFNPFSKKNSTANQEIPWINDVDLPKPHVYDANVNPYDANVNPYLSQST